MSHFTSGDLRIALCYERNTATNIAFLFLSDNGGGAKNPQKSQLNPKSINASPSDRGERRAHCDLDSEDR